MSTEAHSDEPTKRSAVISTASWLRPRSGKSKKLPDDVSTSMLKRQNEFDGLEVEMVAPLDTATNRRCTVSDSCEPSPITTHRFQVRSYCTRGSKTHVAE